MTLADAQGWQRLSSKTTTCTSPQTHQAFTHLWRLERLDARDSWPGERAYDDAVALAQRAVDQHAVDRRA
eukprot:361837-Chlamydomonas_euryale.AAC.6